MTPHLSKTPQTAGRSGGRPECDFISDEWLNTFVGAETEELLDRVTVYREGMEPAALDLMEGELDRRGVTRAQIAEHDAKQRAAAIMLPDGTAMRCSFCDRPAVPPGPRLVPPPGTDSFTLPSHRARRDPVGLLGARFPAPVRVLRGTREARRAENGCEPAHRTGVLKDVPSSTRRFKFRAASCRELQVPS